MTQEDKNLLLKDLCARLPYEVILVAPNGKTTYQTDGNTGAELLVEEGFKPYLRPLSSMTEEEREEWTDLFMVSITQEWEEYADELEAEKVAPSLFAKSHTLSIDWLNKKMFDYRGLIEKCLAIAVTEENNPY